MLTACNLIRLLRFPLSPTYGTPFKVTKVLGGITRDGSGNIVGAKATLATYALKGTSTSAEDETVSLNFLKYSCSLFLKDSSTSTAFQDHTFLLYTEIKVVVRCKQSYISTKKT